MHLISSQDANYFVPTPSDICRACNPDAIASRAVSQCRVSLHGVLKRILQSRKQVHSEWAIGDVRRFPARFRAL